MANLTNGVLPVSIQQIGNNVDPATYPVFMALASYVYSANNDQYGEVLRHINTLKDRVTRAAFTAVVNCQRGLITEAKRDQYIEVLGNDRLRRSFKQLFNKSLSGIPALNLDFANGLDTLDSRITFTRASAATRTNAQGLIETVSTDQPRFDYDPVTLQPKGLLIEEQRTNLLSASSDFEAPVWTKSNATVNANCVVAPDGTLTADKLVEDTTNVIHNASQSSSAAAGTTVTLSVYAKPAERSYVTFDMTDLGTGDVYATFNLASGTYSAVSAGGSWTSPTATIVAVGNGWYRCSLTATKGYGTTFVAKYQLNNGSGTTYTGNGSSGIYIWGAQLEAGAFATSYVATPISFTSRASTATYRGTNGLIQTAASNVARYEPNSSGGSNLLLESAATNLLTYSENFDNAAWSKQNATISADAATAPDGTLTADKLVESASNAQHYVTSGSTTTSTTYTQSVYAKYDGRQYLTLTSWTSYANFDLLNGTIGNTGVTTSTSIQSVGNGWYRCTMTWSSINAQGVVISTNSSNTSSFAPSYTGDGTSGIYIWGAQLETGSVATSYVPTVASQVTRAADVYSAPTVTRSADVASMTGSNFSSWYNSAEGTVYAEADRSETTSTAQVWSISPAGSYGLRYAGAHTRLDRTQTAILITVNNSVSTSAKTSAALKTGSLAVSVNGGTPVNSSDSVVPPTATSLQLGNELGGSFLNGHIKRIAYYPKRLSNTELQGITA